MMNVLRKVTVTALLLFATTSAFADIKMVEFTETMSQEVIPWKSPTKDDGMFFLLGPDSENCLVIKVDERVKKTVELAVKPKADTVTVQCAERIGTYGPHRVHAGKFQTCFGNWSNVVVMYFNPKTGDFHKGSSGTYEFAPLNSPACRSPK